MTLVVTFIPSKTRRQSVVHRRNIEVIGMACDGCERTVENALRNVGGVRRVEADHGTGTVKIVAEDDVTDDGFGAAIHDAGYEVDA